MMEDSVKQHGSTADPKIVIIGAGIAGIAAGRMLAKEGFTNFKIFEASERIGGRIWTVVTDEEGNKAEMGANWIHGVENNPIYQIADENRLLQLRHKDKSLRSKNVFVEENGNVINDRLVKEVDLLYGLLLTQCESFFTDGLPVPENDDSVGGFLQRNFDEKIGHYANGERHVRELIFGHRKLLECCISGCDSLDEVALQDFGSYENLPGIHYTIPPGFDTILDILCKEIPKDNIAFNSSVTCVNWDLGPESKYPVCVELKNGEKHYADHVIVTVPLGILKVACDRMFQPGLPSEKVQAINGLGYGVVDKVFLEFDQPVVDSDVFRLNILWDDDLPHESELCQSWTRKIYSFEVVHEHILVGLLVNTDYFHPVDFFMLFFPESAFQLMADQSNPYAEELLSGITELSQHSRLNVAKDVTVPEMKADTALQIAMGLCCKPENKDYWQTYWLLILPFGTIICKKPMCPTFALNCIIVWRTTGKQQQPKFMVSNSEQFRPVYIFVYIYILPPFIYFLTLVVFQFHHFIKVVKCIYSSTTVRYFR
ncbi:peroxisomal N(1)-acetyl-spermine/spermidine oxidase-like isoform X1 [Babylonia areolata]|uniref:peroxisomal N(1)-acetyl-spermine/spermidine oxidase-like isoform X1 n=1 Tax=Babylonia areolata TaxID=304850 RepID=UPI003FD13D7B